MGEIAEMMLDGTLCLDCGVFLGGSEPGMALLCVSCAWASPALAAVRAKEAMKARCPTCGKRVKAVGLADHVRAAHAGV